MPPTDYLLDRALIRETLTRFEGEIKDIKKQVADANSENTRQFARQTIDLSEKLAALCETLAGKIEARNAKIDKLEKDITRLKTIASLCGAVGGYVISLAKDFFLKK